MTERPNLKQIRIKRSVCDRLDKRKDKDDSYTDVIEDLLDENERLKERVEELKQDKENLFELQTLTRANLEREIKEILEELDDSLILTPANKE